MEKRLFGVLEWIASENGMINQFSAGVLQGIVHKMHYRYFISEGWVGLKTPSCPTGTYEEYKTLKSFQRAVRLNMNSNA